MRSTETLDQSTESLSEICLSYLAQHPEDLVRFMEQTGYDPSSLRGAVGSSQLAHGLIDFFAGNEPLLLAVCANAGLAPETFMRTWHRLNPGH